MTVIDIDEDGTWPRELPAFIERLAADNRGVTTCDQLNLPAGAALVPFLVGTRLRAYHGTRLLDSEIVALRRDGLRPLGDGLVKDKLAAAVTAGLLDERTASELLETYAAHASFDDDEPERTLEICFVVSRPQLDAKTDGLLAFMSAWGGEVIQQVVGMGSPSHEQLKLFGRPTLVVAQINVDGDGTYQDLLFAFVGAKLGLLDRHGEVNHIGGVPPDHIEAIWHPGDPGYDQHAMLPRQ